MSPKRRVQIVKEEEEKQYLKATWGFNTEKINIRLNLILKKHVCGTSFLVFG